MNEYVKPLIIYFDNELVIQPMFLLTFPHRLLSQGKRLLSKETIFDD